MEISEIIAKVEIGNECPCCGQITVEKICPGCNACVSCGGA